MATQTGGPPGRSLNLHPTMEPRHRHRSLRFSASLPEYVENAIYRVEHGRAVYVSRDLLLFEQIMNCVYVCWRESTLSSPTGYSGRFLFVSVSLSVSVYPDITALADWA